MNLPTVWSKRWPSLPSCSARDREASVSRELTKKFEENARGTLRELIVHFSAREVKGEIVIVLGGKPRKAKREDADNGAVDDAEENGLQED